MRFIFCFLLLNSYVRASDFQEVVVFGDSISAAALSDFYARPKNIWETTFLGFLKGFWGEWKKYFDSGKEALPLVRFENRNRSWATGNKIYGNTYSIVELLKKDGIKIRHIKNYAISGSVTQDVLEQVERFKPKTKNPLALVLIGANDLCGASLSNVTNPQEYEKYLEQVITGIQNKGGNPFLVFPPNLTHLISSVANEEVQVSEFKTERCSTVWSKMLQFCKVVTTGIPQNLEEIERLEKEYYERFIRLADHYNLGRSSGLYEAQYGINDLSVDCFHPNGRGQRRIANTVYQELKEYLSR